MASVAEPRGTARAKAGGGRRQGKGPGGGQPGRGDLRRHVEAFLRAVHRFPRRRRIYLLTAAIVAVLCATAYGQIRLNAWQGDFYDALAKHHLTAFVHQLLVFVAIVAGLLTLGVSQTWLQETMKIDLRDAVSRDLLNQWLQPRRAYQLAWAGDIGDNPDQRIHEDSRHLTELCSDLGVGLLQASLLLVSFVGVLWVLSERVVLQFDGQRFNVPGYMVWCALAYALAGSWATWRVGRPLIPLNAERYAREADFRFALVHLNEAAEAVGLYSGEHEARRDLGHALEETLKVMRRLARGLANLTWVTAGYGWLGLVVPIAVASPGYFNGSLSFGDLMMVTGAFLQVQQSLRWFVDNFSRIADWRATLLRVMTLRLTLPELETLGGSASRITFGRHPRGHLALDSLRIQLPDKRVSLTEGDLEMKPGERVVITGGAGAGKSMLFRAIAGLWPWGSGQVLLPPPEELLFLPQRPYLPIGTLRRALAYPAPAEVFAEAEFERVLQRVGLGRLHSHLDEERRWDKQLALDEQQTLAFARLLLHRPAWVVMDDPLNALELARRSELCGIFDQELAGTAVLAVGRTTAAAPFFGRAVPVIEEPDGVDFRLPQLGSNSP
ncbi:putative ATP-binding cassette transporter [Tistlia consotensis]|uniref:Putative ATP-binding cassette transporter n=1 Tax=Tistlia consotensis USBA 355 TaxID=560819 RepID=A0A1Y6CFI9_9PROT|nr:ABC transporter ATP-binding protein/permease [Tistlia consotensis]SMF58683.1 putative ATP-binding cassette transporter [Tistlia consotensis USBA 355]SNR63619.1 putative ATP-binding cassette transporter [Tistlia consotensis]